MPLDGSSYTKSEIDILDEMSLTLSSPEKWCKGHLWEGKEAETNPNVGQHCLYGALNLADHDAATWHGPFDFKTGAAFNVHRRLAESESVTPSWPPESAAVNFNNAPETTHADILDLIERTKQSFVSEIVSEKVLENV